LVPSVWHVVDLVVWKTERERLARCPDSLVVVASKKIFGGGPYSVAGSNSLRVVGRRKWPIAEISIQPAKGAVRTQSGKVQRQHTPPFMPKSMREQFHPGGNSLCYMIQTAHLMGCSPIYCLGFTLVSGTGYFFGLENPATGKRSFYSDPDRAIEWLRWYQSRWPGRVRLWPGWSGPIYDVLEVMTDGEAQQLIRESPELRKHEPLEVTRGEPDVSVGRREDRHEPVEGGGNVPEGQRLPNPGRRQPVHRHGQQPGGQRTPAAVHGHVRSQSGQGTRQVPKPRGG
jgi:hypothetical protein